MKLYETNSGLGYREKAILLELEKEGKKVKCLCIALINFHEDYFCCYDISGIYTFERQELDSTEETISVSQISKDLIEYIVELQNKVNNQK